ncbi:uncharacterized protein CLUP02_06957 [Colletotrichum lupini]|uniref:Uncharacterized protein n=1 Tax=Colletotrichum lupini TaxID=145971 RepID=A0A9Q8WFM0_9PEZI|nr:uncharacterized protein CLUP02_06957 [Colletotrichum lupini]UQC81471.1 hypothetical protein CLUP02_06957 [Colletotrichum lupini]
MAPMNSTGDWYPRSAAGAELRAERRADCSAPLARSDLGSGPQTEMEIFQAMATEESERRFHDSCPNNSTQLEAAAFKPK